MPPSGLNIPFAKAVALPPFVPIAPGKCAVIAGADAVPTLFVCGELQTT